MLHTSLRFQGISTLARFQTHQGYLQYIFLGFSARAQTRPTAIAFPHDGRWPEMHSTSFVTLVQRNCGHSDIDQDGTSCGR